ncbi:hypothetical protein Tco_0837940 [Tanacetum coccineum]
MENLNDDDDDNNNNNNNNEQQPKTYVLCENPWNTYQKKCSAVPQEAVIEYKDKDPTMKNELRAEKVKKPTANNYQINALVKILAMDFDCEKNELKLRMGTKTEVFSITHDDFSTLMEIKNGPDPFEKKPSCDDKDLLEKFCTKDTNDKYQDICVDKIIEVLHHGNDPTAIKQANTLLAMDLVVCPNTRGKLGKGMLSYVQDVNHLNDHPWVSMAIDALTKGIKTYQVSKASERSLGGCAFFLQLYYMSKLHEGLVLSKIDDAVTTQFKSNWEREYAVVTGKSKPLMDETWGILKEIHKNYSANRKSVDVEHLVELNLLSRKMQNYQSKILKIIATESARDQAHGFDKPPLDESEQTLQATGPEANKKKKKQPKAGPKKRKLTSQCRKQSKYRRRSSRCWESRAAETVNQKQGKTMNTSIYLVTWQLLTVTSISLTDCEVSC